MSSEEERAYISLVLRNEITAHFREVAKEYQQERDLGMRGEFANLYRKIRKLKTVIWDGKGDEGWREGYRKIALEVVAHGLLMLCDIDREEGNFDDRLAKAREKDALRTPNAS